MKRLMLTPLVSLLLAFTAKGQDDALVREKWLTIDVGLSNWGVPLTSALDFTALRNFTVGVAGTFQSQSRLTTSAFPERWRVSLLGLRLQAMYHFAQVFQLNPKLDPYGGVSLAYYLQLARDLDFPQGYVEGQRVTVPRPIEEGYGTPGLSAHVGFRFWFKDKLAGHIEFTIGTLVSSGSLGVTIKL
jgi:hypothetical protein